MNQSPWNPGPEGLLPLGLTPPKAVFDAHAHVYRKRDVAPRPSLVEAGPESVGFAEWQAAVAPLFPESALAGGLLLPYPSRDGNVREANAFAVAEAARARGCRAGILATPGMARAEAEALLRNPVVAALKPYHVYAPVQPTSTAEIADYLPAWAWELAQDHGLVIVLHLVRDRALADPANQRALRTLCRRWPGAKLLLAHAGRGFHAPNTVQGIHALQGLENLWFDAAAVCESAAMRAVLENFGPRKLLWGSDFPVSLLRGRCVTWGDGFAWVTADLAQDHPEAFHGRPLPVGIESLRALAEAAEIAGLEAGDLEDIFFNNAQRLFNPNPEPSGRLTRALHRQALKRIPGGTQLLSKRPEMFAPGQWPAYFREAIGCEVWDLDGRHFYDCATHGIGACLLGYRDPDVTRAVRRRLGLGAFSILNPPEEVALADLLCELHPWAEQVRFARTGGEAMSVAVRIARAVTDRSEIAFCGYHGWHDWYLAANLGEADALRGHLLPGLEPLGVPRELRNTAHPFQFNDREAFERILAEHGTRLAAVVMEPCRNADPEPGFLEFVRDRAHRAGALLVFDEITIGWRLTLGGAHLRLGVHPDIAVFAKALGNGHPMAAILGTNEAMAGAHRSFISSTYWTESLGPAAALATLRKMQRIDVPGHCARIGGRVQNAWRNAARETGVPIEVPHHYPALAHFRFNHEKANELRTLFTQQMLKRGFLAGTALYVSLAHTDEIIDRYIDAVFDVFAELAEIIAAGRIADALEGPPAHRGFQRLL